MFLFCVLNTYNIYKKKKTVSLTSHTILLTNTLDPIMFADDTNLFYSHHESETLFFIVNKELEKLGGWFTANRL